MTINMLQGLGPCATDGWVLGGGADQMLLRLRRLVLACVEPRAQRHVFFQKLLHLHNRQQQRDACSAFNTERPA